MGVDYTYYAEVKFRGQWRLLGPWMPSLVDGELRASHFISGRHYLEEVTDLMSENGFSGLPDDPSTTLLELLKGKENQSLEDRCFITCDLESLRGHIKNDYEPLYKGYVLKRDIAQYEAGVISTIYDYLDPDEYGRLSKNVQARYRYFVWDDFDEFYYQNLQHIFRIVNYLFSTFESFAFHDFYDESFWDDIEEARKSIRLIVEVW